MVGQKFGAWTVKAEGKRRTHVLCECECGTMREVDKYSLSSGRSISCHCRQTVHGHAGRGTRTKTYVAWQAIVARCTNPKHPRYARYGGRGIRLHPAWEDFNRFLEDVGEIPQGLSIDRIDNDGNYEPGNIRFSTVAEQNTNYSRTRYFTYQNKTMPVVMWAKEYGVPYYLAYDAVKYGRDFEKVVARYRYNHDQRVSVLEQYAPDSVQVV